MSTTPVQSNPNDEIRNLYVQKGELITQLEIAQGQLQQVNFRLNQLLGLTQAPTQVK